MPEWALALERSAFATALRESSWLFPTVEAIHILGFVLVAGPAIYFDLRLLGLGRALPVPDLARHLLRGSVLAFLVLVVPTGAALFASQAGALSVNRVFWLKLALIALAGVNALSYRMSSPRPRIVALISIVCWVGVIGCGRFLAYT